MNPIDYLMRMYVPYDSAGWLRLLERDYWFLVLHIEWGQHPDLYDHSTSG